jgi:hypothetical protein
MFCSIKTMSPTTTVDTVVDVEVVIPTQPTTEEEWDAQISSDMCKATPLDIGRMRGYVIGLSYKDAKEAARLATTLNTNLKAARETERDGLVSRIDKRMHVKYGDLI